VTGRPAERLEGTRNGPVAFLGSGRPDQDTGGVLNAGGNALVPDADTQPIEVTANHPLSPVTITTSARDFRAGPADAGRRRRTGRYSAEATAALGYLVRTTGAPPSPPRPVVDRTHAWLAVALVAALVVLVSVASDAATVSPPGFSERPVVTTVVTVPVPSDPRATEGPAPQDRHRVLSW
jgi:hypothetical protein